MKFTVSSTLCAAACFLASDFAPASLALAVKPSAGNLRTLEWGGGGREGGDKGRDNGPEGDNGPDNKDRDEHDREDRDEHDREDRDEHDREDRDEHDREDEHDKEDERDRDEQDRREQDREREEGRFDCPPDRPWLCAPTPRPTVIPPTIAPSNAPTAAPTFITTASVGIFGSGVFGSGNITQDAEIGLALGIAICVCGAFLAVFVAFYRYDMHKILAMKILSSDKSSFNPRMHEQGTAIDVSIRDDASIRGGESVSGGIPPAGNDSDWGVSANGAVEPKKSRKSRSGKTIDF